MRCDDARNRWLLAADGGLSRRRQEAMQAHLKACVRCRDWTTASERRLLLARSMMPDRPLHEGTRAVIWAAAKRLRPQDGSRTLRHPFSLPAMAAAILLLTGLAVWQAVRVNVPPDGPPAFHDAGRLRVADQLDALAYLLEPPDAGREVNDSTARTASDPLIDWVLRTQAAETMQYLNDRLDAASG